MTWPQPMVLATHAMEHQDVFFNLWRVRWVAHALFTTPSALFNGNQFYPERGVLAYSDAMLIEGVIGAPLLWAGVPPVLVHNLLLLGAIVASAAGIFALARHLTGNATGAVAAGVIFAFAPYRFDHYMHMELQWIVWAPWAFWALQRTIETGAPRFGILTGVFLALQMLSSIYYGIFLGLLLGVVGGVQMIALSGRRIRTAVLALALGVVVAAGVSWLYSVPYASASARVGTRGVGEVRQFSAKPRSYLSATPTNYLYGARHRSLPERRLFPGVLPLVLALVGLLLVPPSPPAIAYLIGLAAAFELSLGMNGLVYPLLYERLGVLHGLRAPARAAVFCLLFIGILAAYGCAALTRHARAHARHALGVAAVAILMLEYWVAPLQLIPYHNDPPPLYAWLARQPRGVVAEFPVPPFAAWAALESRYLYMSTFHWRPLINGYSGYFPPSYLQRLEGLVDFPGLTALQQLRGSGVRYIVVHGGEFSSQEYADIVEALLLAGLTAAGPFFDGWGSSTVFRLR